jgi:hypothetical protein
VPITSTAKQVSTNLTPRSGLFQYGDENTGFLVLASRVDVYDDSFSGIVVQSNMGSRPVGFYVDAWKLSQFNVWYGKVTLESTP